MLWKSTNVKETTTTMTMTMNERNGCVYVCVCVGWGGRGNFPAFIGGERVR